MKTCTDHSFIVVYREDSCPVCAMEMDKWEGCISCSHKKHRPVGYARIPRMV